MSWRRPRPKLAEAHLSDDAASRSSSYPCSFTAVRLTPKRSATVA